MKTIAKPINKDGYLFACEEVHISQVKQGDTVFHNGQSRTVGRESIQRDSFCGYSLFGDPYLLGTKPVIRFINTYGGKLVPANN